MSLTTDDEIRKEILEDWELLSESSYPDDILNESADSAVPIYTNDIIAEWGELPTAYDDAWAEFGMPDTITITRLMTLSLYHYYQDRYTQIYQEILDEKEEEEDNE